jgi:hypothetical protein
VATQKEALLEDALDQVAALLAVEFRLCKLQDFKEMVDGNTRFLAPDEIDHKIEAT